MKSVLITLFTISMAILYSYSYASSKQVSKGAHISNVPDSLSYVFAKVQARFEELYQVPIRLEFKKIKTTMQAQPRYDFSFLFKRQYRVIINNDSNFVGIHFKNLTTPMREAIIAHELSHLVTYHGKNKFQLLLHGMGYLFKSTKRRNERATDMITIKKGFGPQMIQWAQFAMYDGPATPAYKKFKQSFYLNPIEIDSIVKKML